MSILQNHHIIPQKFADHEALSEFDVEAANNRIYLPSDLQLAANMGLSSHSGGHIDSYYNGVLGALEALKDETDPVARAGNVGKLVDAMRVALANGDLYANVTEKMTQDEADRKNNEFFANWEQYTKSHKDQIDAIRALEERGVRSQLPHLAMWSAIVNDQRRVDQLNDAIRNNRGVNVTAGNRNLDGTPFARFSAAGPIPDLRGLTPLDPTELRPLPGILRQTDTYQLPGFVPPPTVPLLPGFTPSNPLLQLPGLAPPPAGFAGPQIIAQSSAQTPAQIISNDFAETSKAKLNGAFTGAPPEREPGLGSGEAVFALLPLILAAVPELTAAGATAMLARVATRGLVAAATRTGAPAMLARAAGVGGGLLPAAMPTGATAGLPTPNQVVADDFQSLKDASAGSLTPLDRSEPDSQPFVGRADSPIAPTVDGSDKGDPKNQRRVSNLTDEINGGPGRAIQQFPATLNRAAQLAGLPDGGIALGQRTPFPPPSPSISFIGLPAVLRALADASALAPTNEENVGWQQLTPLHLPSDDDLDIPGFLRRKSDNKIQNYVRGQWP